MTNNVGTPAYINQVTHMDRTTPADGTVFDAIHQQLLNNDAFLNAEILGMLQKAVNSGVIDYVGAPHGMDSAGLEIGGYGTPATPSTTYINSFQLDQFKAIINGTLIQAANINPIGATNNRNIVVLDASPALNVTPALPGSARDDLVFLEMWLDATTGAPKYRIRVADGVDFATYPEGLSALNVYAQGGNSVATTKIFSKATSISGQSFSPDNGLYVAGSGTTADQAALATFDGYVYAIPLFRVHRRNNAGFDPDNNPLGAIDYLTATADTNASYTPLATTFNPGQSLTINMTGALPSTFAVGKALYRVGGTFLMGTISAISGTQVTVTLAQSIASGFTVGGNLYYVNSDRPDGLYSNIIDASDITDLRHQVSLTGFNYQALLEKNLDLLLRGQLTTNKNVQYGRDFIGLNVAGNMPDDANTLLRVDFNSGTINGTANGTAVNGTLNTGTASFVNGVQGQAFNPASGSPAQYISYPISIASGTNVYSIEFMIKPTWAWVSDGKYRGLISLNSANGGIVNIDKNASNQLRIGIVAAASASTNESSTSSAGLAAGSLPSNFSPDANVWHKVLITVNNGNVAMYIDGIALTMSGGNASLPAITDNIVTAWVGIDAGLNLGSSYLPSAAFDSVRISNNVRSETLLPSAFSYFNGDRILDGPNGDFAQWSDDLGGVTGVNGRTNPYGLTHVQNQMAGRISVNGQEIRHYYGNGVTLGWNQAVTSAPAPAGSMESTSAASSGEYILVTANEVVDGMTTTFTFTKPANAQNIEGIYGGNFGDIVQVNGAYITPSSVTLNNTSGLLTATLSSVPASGATVRAVFTTVGRHAHFIPSTKGFIVHDWTDDSVNAGGTPPTTYQTTKYNVTSINHVRVTPNGGTSGTIQNGGYSTSGLNAITTLSANAASGATTITVASASNFVANQNIRISNGSGGWVTATIASISGTTITLTAGLSAAVSQNAIVQGTAIVTFTTAPAASSIVDIVYESVYTPALGDYIRVMYQHTPYQGMGAVNDTLTMMAMDSAIRGTTRGTGKVPAHNQTSLPNVTPQLPITASMADCNFKGDSIVPTSISSTVGSPLSTSSAYDSDYILSPVRLRSYLIMGIESILGTAFTLSNVTNGASAPARGLNFLNVNNTAFDFQAEDIPSAVPHLSFLAMISKDQNGVLRLIIATFARTDKAMAVSTNCYDAVGIDTFLIQGRPLIKNYGGVSA